MTIIYEGAVSSGAVGGARMHFRGMARALARNPDVGSLTIVLPAFAGEEPLDLGLPAQVVVRRPPALRRGLAGHASYELSKTFVLLATRANDLCSRQRTTLMSRITPVGFAPLLLRLTGARVVIEVNGLPDTEFRARGFGRATVAAVRLVTNAQLRAATHVVAVTDGLADAVRRRTGAPVTRIENAVDLDDVDLEAASANPGDPHTLAYSGAFAPWQELELLVDALAALVRRSPTTPWKLLLIGDGEDRPVIERRAVELGVADRVEITGWLDQTDALDRLLAARVAVVPLKPKGDSDVCGSPLKLFEYLAAGRTVVGSDVDGIAELTDYPVTIYEHGNLDAMVAALESAVSGTSEQGQDGDLTQRLSWDDRCSRILDSLEI